MPAPNAAALFRRNLALFADRPAVRFEDRVLTHREFVEEAWRWAHLFLDRRPPAGRPFHVGVLMDNIPEYLLAFAGAAFAGATLVGLNPTRRGAALERDIAHTDVPFVVTEEAYLPLLSELASPPPVLTVGPSLDAALARVATMDPGLEPDPSTAWALIFTSGTSDAPKAVICSQRRIMVTGTRMGIIMDITPDDVGYVCMPLFHSNAVMVGWAPSIVYGASVGLGRRFSASRWLADVRRYGATWFNYTGKPLSYLLATAEKSDDADNPLRIAFGNEGSPQVVADFSRRFGVEVIDAFGATEGGVAVNRAPDMPPGAMGLVGDNVKVVSEDGSARPAAQIDADGRLVNADVCVGEIINTAGVGPFEGYYNNDAANARTTRNGWYWSGDLGYVDSAGYLYFAGRNAEWIRVDGENFPAAPIEAAVSRHPDVMLAAVYGVPDEQAGDQVMAALVLREGASFDPAEFAAWIDSQVDVGPKWRPRYLRVSVTGVLPSTATNKVLKRTLVQQKFRRDLVDDDALYVRDRGAPAYRAFTEGDEARVHDALDHSGRGRFWDL
jgi:fatty-acyl-CoA synthase